MKASDSPNPFDHPRNPNYKNLMEDASNQQAKPQQNIPMQTSGGKSPRETLLARIENDFRYHSPKQGQAERYELIRSTALKLARVMVENCPNSRELSTALTTLETAVMHANAAIARNE